MKACKSRKPEILESEKEIQYMYEGQNRRIKSMIAIPVLGETGLDLMGVITICADVNYFFKNSDIELHTENINEFGIRIAMEIIHIESITKKQKKK